VGQLWPIFAAMNHSTPMLSPQWSAYELLDSGFGEKLERFGDYILIRPEPQALWPRAWDEQKWYTTAHARFEQSGSHQGVWTPFQEMDNQWLVSYRFEQQSFRMRLALTQFKHVGVFPEQAANWDYIYHQCQRLHKQTLGPKSTEMGDEQTISDISVLNLFAYTGGASLAARAAGAQVTHVDAIKQVVQWAKNNAGYQQWHDMRWIVEDVLRFVEREIRRKKRYQGIILDPPAYGNGPNGEKWIMEKHIDELVAATAELLDPNHHFYILNAYSLGYSPLILENLIYSHFGNVGDLTCGELYLIEQSLGRKLPAGIVARFCSTS
jgi:23S rRNA (cytosine1962-C5)-methyltransferase